MELQTSAERLLRLADFLDALPPERFDYRYWVGVEWGGAPDLSCGTTACALGWAATMPEFNRLGLTLANGRQGTGVFLYNGDRTPPFYAAERVFGLTPDEARFVFSPNNRYGWLFSPDEDASAREVAKHLRRFVRQRDALAKYDAGLLADDPPPEDAEDAEDADD